MISRENIIQNAVIPSEKKKRTSADIPVRCLTSAISSVFIASVRTGRSEFRNTVPYIIPTSTIFIGTEYSAIEVSAIHDGSMIERRMISILKNITLRKSASPYGSDAKRI